MTKLYKKVWVVLVMKETAPEVVDIYDNKEAAQNACKLIESETLIYEKTITVKDERDDSRVIEDLVNNGGFDSIGTVKKLQNMHRYLKGECFRFCYNFLMLLARDYDRGAYDERDERACRKSKKLLDGTISFDEVESDREWFERKLR